MKIDKESLVKSILIYLYYDQKAHKEWKDPSPANSDFHIRMKKDAENIADIAIRHFKKSV